MKIPLYDPVHRRFCSFDKHLGVADECVRCSDVMYSDKWVEHEHAAWFAEYMKKCNRIGVPTVLVKTKELKVTK